MKITCGDFLAGGGGVTHALSKIKNAKVKFSKDFKTDAHNLQIDFDQPI